MGVGVVGTAASLMPIGFNFVDVKPVLVKWIWHRQRLLCVTFRSVSRIPGRRTRRYPLAAISFYGCRTRCMTVLRGWVDDTRLSPLRLASFRLACFEGVRTGRFSRKLDAVFRSGLKSRYPHLTVRAYACPV